MLNLFSITLSTYKTLMKPYKTNSTGRSEKKKIKLMVFMAKPVFFFFFSPVSRRYLCIEGLIPPWKGTTCSISAILATFLQYGKCRATLTLLSYHYSSSTYLQGIQRQGLCPRDPTTQGPKFAASAYMNSPIEVNRP